MERMRPYSPTYRTTCGQMFEGRCEDILAAPSVIRLKGKTHLIFTSPPFPLNRKKKYGNLQGEEYVAWLSSLAPLLRDYLAPKGSIVIGSSSPLGGCGHLTGALSPVVNYP